MYEISSFRYSITFDAEESLMQGESQSVTYDRYFMGLVSRFYGVDVERTRIQNNVPLKDTFHTPLHTDTERVENDSTYPWKQSCRSSLFVTIPYSGNVVHMTMITTDTDQVTYSCS